MKIFTTGLILLTVSLLLLSVGFLITSNQLHRIRPQLKEEMVSVQTVKMDGDIYICGTVVGNRDKESLYCRGYTDGYSWAVAQDNIDKQLAK